MDSSVPGSDSDVPRTLLSDESEVSRVQPVRDTLLMSSQQFPWQPDLGNHSEQSKQSTMPTTLEDSPLIGGLSLGLDLLSVAGPPESSSGLSTGATGSSSEDLSRQYDKEMHLKTSQDLTLVPQEPSPIPPSVPNGMLSPPGGLAPLIIKRNYPQEHAAEGVGGASASSFSPYPLSTMATNTPNTLSPNLTRCKLQRCGRVADSKFMPCGHIVVCVPCSECFKLCHECRVSS